MPPAVSYPTFNPYADLLFGNIDLRDRDYAAYLARRLPPLGPNPTGADRQLYQLLQETLAQQLIPEYRDADGYYIGPDEFLPYLSLPDRAEYAPTSLSRVMYGDLNPSNATYNDPALQAFAQGQQYNAGLDDEWNFFGDQFATALLGLTIATGAAGLYGAYGATAPAVAETAGEIAPLVAPAVPETVGEIAPLVAPAVAETAGEIAPLVAPAVAEAAGEIAPVALGGLTAPAAPTGAFLSTGAGGAGVFDTLLGSLVGPAINAATSLIGGALQNDAIGDAAETQRQAGLESNRLLRDIYLQNRADTLPFLQAGTQALPLLAQLAGTREAAPTYTATPTVNPADIAANMDPGREFRLREGQRLLETSAAARGGLLSGGTGRALTRYGQEMASQEYQNAFGRAVALNEQASSRNREQFGINFDARNLLSNQQFNRLASLAGLGQTSAQALGALGQGYSGQAAQNLTNLGNVAAAGQIGQTNAWVNALSALGGSASQITQYQQLRDLLSSRR